MILDNYEVNQIEKLKNQFEQIDLDRQKEIDFLKESVNSLQEKNNTNNDLSSLLELLKSDE